MWYVAERSIGGVFTELLYASLHYHLFLFSLHYWSPSLLYLQDGRSLFYAVVRSGNIDLVKWFAKEYNPPQTVTKVCLACLFKMPIIIAVHNCMCVVTLWLSLCIYRYIPQDGGSLLLPAAESGSIEVVDWLVHKYKLPPNQWSEVSY